MACSVFEVSAFSRRSFSHTYITLSEDQAQPAPRPSDIRSSIRFSPTLSLVSHDTVAVQLIWTITLLHTSSGRLGCSPAVSARTTPFIATATGRPSLVASGFRSLPPPHIWSALLTSHSLSPPTCQTRPSCEKAPRAPRAATTLHLTGYRISTTLTSRARWVWR